ncbi:selenoprotein S-like isoform X1 [Alosa pseudoharengus]|uniref:selenoprotein S-like isoform X1 n=1 Tax=Alosa pseudoharengus TaxID=34774 RepID=UPI003F88F07B
MEADENPPDIRSTSALKNQDLNFLQLNVAVILADYGWYLLCLCIGVYVVLQHLQKKRPRQDQSATPGEVPGPKDPVSVVRRQEAMEAARKKMQEELDAKAALFLERQQELEEEKRQQKIEKWESMKEGKSFKGNSRVTQNSDEAGSSTVLKPKSDKKSLRSTGYNPLSGAGGGSCAWRPGRRGPSAGG